MWAGKFQYLFKILKENNLHEFYNYHLKMKYLDEFYKKKLVLKELVLKIGRRGGGYSAHQSTFCESALYIF